MQDHDARAFAIFRNYDLLHPESTSAEDFDYATRHGLMFPVVEMKHDDLIQAAFSEFEQAKPEKIARSFLYGLAHDRPELRAAISAYAVMTHYPRHDYVALPEATEGGQCRHCTLRRETRIDQTFSNRCRWTGSLVGSSHTDNLWFYLKQHNAQAVPHLAPGDEEPFVNLLRRIAVSGDDETPTTLRKRLGKEKLFRMKVEELRALVDALGYMGILRSREHPGYLHKYPGYNPPQKSRSSDWAYPVDFWTGKDGIDLTALDHWFSDVPAIVAAKPSFLRS